MITARTFLLFLFIFLSSSHLMTGQSTLVLPQLLPSYSEDFSDYSSYPSMSFENAFLDKNGRLWLNTSGFISLTSNLHLFQFDGYQFKLIRGELNQLQSTDYVAEIFADEKLVGGAMHEDGNKLFFYDLNSNQIQFHPLETPGVINDVSVSEAERIFLTIQQNDQISLFEWQEGAMEKQGQFNEPVLNSPEGSEFISEVLYHDESVFWGVVRLPGYYIRIDKTSGQSKKFHFSDLDYQESNNRFSKNTTPEVFGLYQNEQFYIADQNLVGSPILKWDAQTDQLVRLDRTRQTWAGENIFQDQSGNLVFLFKNTKNQYVAILQDKAGRRFDYSAFLAGLSVGESINQMVSRDFKQDVIICHAKGISVHTVKASEAIHTFLPGHPIRAMVELEEEKYLIRSQRDQLFIIDGKTNTVTNFDAPCTFGWTKFHKDEAGYVWTHDRNYMVKYDHRTNTCETYPCQAEIIRLFTFIDKNRIALVTRIEELYIHDLATQKTTPVFYEGKPLSFPGYTHDILFSQNNDLWVATNQGLWKIDIEKNEAEVLGNEPPFETPRFLSMTEDEKGRLWLGTPLHGLYIYDPQSEETINLNNEAGMPNNTVANMIADDEGIRWVGTYNGISLISKDGELITNLYPKDGLIERENNRYATLKTSTGRLLIGSVSGVNLIDAKKVKERISRNKNLKIYLTSLSYFDSEQGQDVQREYGLNGIREIELPAARRFLNLSFAVSNYFRPEQNQYSYMLEGINDQWTPLGNQHSLSLSNLPPGKYDLLIRGSDDLGNWTPEPLRISIDAKNFFYKQVWFYLLLLLLLGGIAMLWIYRLRIEVKQATEKIRLDKEIIEQQANELLELDEAKSRFFTNISHEFRTPLTIISGMIDQVREKPDVWLERGSKMIKQNTAGLLNLVNQILDLRKLESNELKVEMVQGDIVKYLRYLTESYHSYAENKGLQIHFLSAKPEIQMDYDPEKLLRIVSNLLSNALKFTPEGGNIYLHIDKKTHEHLPHLHLRVQDTGVGIPQEDLRNIFGRFYQVDDSSTRQGEGTGIGLALTQELVKLLGGEIKAESIVGKGTTFHVTLPITNNAAVQANEPGLEEKIETITLASAQTAPKSPPTTAGINTDDSPSLLIVEDNPDVQQFLIACLEGHYQLETANNGQEGIDKAIEQVPDLIVSDVMMPEKDGYELTEILKNDERTSHIPIILLTAKADQQSKISGLKTGADAYLTKPFEREELMVRLEKLFELRQKLQARYHTLEPTSKPENKEDEFVQKVRQVVLENLSDDIFGIPQLCRKIALSRAQLHNKLKALTGQSTSHFIRTIRLNEAKKLLENSDLNISEVGYEVGFKNPSHFSSAFQEEFGFPPSKTRN